ncbi:ribosome biogenesis GTPase [Acetivibrio thermocellus AD2]|uniref:Small ribosomal subunit biogenesis GTPase RsgA n=1 Tax=Acetivibrio thermocellus AD2 TaxID=1138384 RepID=A0AB36TJ87_ACETH|nr:ribosome small subunit-dependent GTPase A [Acetivibrio thermocellus]ADU75308.1 ribosome small subunit-dependent GTPase A [Acetivibrio thermocellus DSM 1313]ALX09300.1 ribosome biogenesis GTPase RsgA [Acetivibrio thermocellus AD2]ANV77052.1 ribosome biogenesis GTPase RsgA [Acetivibrio thermocellus DSM 2360]EIC04768.1 ribosome biogenesis GTPase RsgA [Acetivibrio thermocellus YS]NLU27299.1 ribosome small subunit-dependent GTPase A [Acetivibrio thermocellus]
MNLIDYGFVPTMMSEDVSGFPARITAVHKERYELVCEYGYTFGRLKTSIYYAGGFEDFPTAGDFVLIDYNPDGDSRIVKTLKRKSFFSRRNPTPGKGEQAVAANFDYVFVMQSLNHDFNLRRMERYVTLTWQSGAVPVIVLTKADLVEDCSEQVLASQKVAPGVEVHAISTITGFGLDVLKDYLKPCKTVVFLGSSGVGKSSLVNALAGQEIMAVGDIREDDSKGRHTTTHRQLIMLPGGAMIIDTPGMRELGMLDDVSVGLGETFSDVVSYLGRCKFSDCRHQTEPGCVVRAAIERGELPKERWESYLKLKREANFSDDKEGYLRQKQQWSKEIAKWSKKMKKNGGIRK